MQKFKLVIFQVLALLLSGCMTSSIYSHKDALNSYSFYSAVGRYDANEHKNVANNFCKDKNKSDLAKIISAVREGTEYDDIIRTRFFCGTPEKIQQIEAQQAIEKDKAQKAAEENRLAESKRQALAAENAAIARETNRKSRLEKISKITPKTPGELALIGSIHDDTLNEDYCSKITGITASAQDDLATAWKISSFSFRLVSTRLVGGTAACCLKLDTPKGPFQNVALNYYINSKQQIFVSMNNRGYREGESNHMCTLF